LAQGTREARRNGSLSEYARWQAQRRRRAGTAEQYVAKAREHCVSLRSKRVSPHVLRHSAAMELLQAGVDCSVIALWLGHEAMETTLPIFMHILN